ncbi:MAG: hypothetical protein ACOVP1_09665 [Bacteroidia bacterium]
MISSLKEKFRVLGLIIIAIISLFIGTLMLISGNEFSPYTLLEISPGINLKLTNTQQLLVGGICFASVIVLFGKRNQHP